MGTMAAFGENNEVTVRNLRSQQMPKKEIQKAHSISDCEGHRQGYGCKNSPCKGVSMTRAKSGRSKNRGE